MQLCFHSCTSFIFYASANNNGWSSSNTISSGSSSTTTLKATTNSTTTTTAITQNRMLFSIKAETCVAYTCNIMSLYTCLLLFFYLVGLLRCYYFLFVSSLHIESFWMLFIGWLFIAMRCFIAWPMFYGHFICLKCYDQKWCMGRNDRQSIK